MTNKDIIKIAMKQSAIESNCNEEDFISEKNICVVSKENNQARKYLKLPFICDLTSYGSNIVASCSKELIPIVSNYINSTLIEYCFETPILHQFIEKLKPFDANVCFMANYFLPDVDRLVPLDCPYDIKILNKEQLKTIENKTWPNALSSHHRDNDQLALGAYDQDNLIGIAGCSNDCDTMWQIGVDVLKVYRNKNVASALTSRLAIEVLSRGIVPFYCCAWSNIRSVRNAIKSGFKPSWIQLTVKSNDFINGMK